ncbi:1625_t:CDS:1 [Funneliformis geosporum]|uniref:18107_t:CDS:1 n=1 Tax=Funneliformis geosporum TaxID=1117311 RepID=A0A9W4WTW4_9GLOM|nr:1625_t:CDS:1 [Funneliformis geosporum]CAI2178617.1 18107_t:CDS:1 [Funneliformis geosporum]
MTETVEYQSCQSNINCTFAIVGQICSGEGWCIFECLEDSDCISGGICTSAYNCDWSGKPTPPLLKESLASPQDLTKSADTTNANGTSTTNEGIFKLNSPFVLVIVIITLLVLVCAIATLLFFVFRRKKNNAEGARGLRPLTLSPSAKRSKKDSREKDSRSVKKPPHQYDSPVLFESEDEGKEEPFEESFSEGAVGSAANQPSMRSPPVRSQTMYGSSTPSTSFVELSSPLPPFQHQHHFMAAEDNDPQQQQQQRQSP